MAEPESPDVSDATRAEEAVEAAKHGGADRPPTPEEEALAEQNSLDPDVAAAYDEANKRGADVKGEGQIVPD